MPACSALIVFLYGIPDALSITTLSQRYATLYAEPFSVTVDLLFFGVILFLLWALYLSFRPARAMSEGTSDQRGSATTGRNK